MKSSAAAREAVPAVERDRGCDRCRRLWCDRRRRGRDRRSGHRPDSPWGRITVKRARFQTLEVDELTVRKLRVLGHARAAAGRRLNTPCTVMRGLDPRMHLLRKGRMDFASVTRPGAVPIRAKPR
mgnify:CR=1 FL=1